MPKTICVKCQIEYKPEKNGVVVEEMASFGSYKLWSADLWKCPKCGHEIIAGFADRNFAEHYQPDYKDILEKVSKTYKCYEK